MSAQQSDSSSDATAGKSWMRWVFITAGIVAIVGIVYVFQSMGDTSSLAFLGRDRETAMPPPQTATATQLSPIIAVDMGSSQILTVVGASWPPVTDVVIGLAAGTYVDPSSATTDEFYELGMVTSTREGTFTTNLVWETGEPAGDASHVLAFVPNSEYRATASLPLPVAATPPPTQQPSPTAPALPTPRSFVLPTPLPLPTIPTSTPFPTLALPTYAATNFSSSPRFTPAATGRDGYEPDDTAEEASYIALGETQIHSFFPTGDVDKVRFRTKPGRHYRVYTQNLGLGVDTKLILAVGANTCVPDNCQNDDATLETLASEVTFVAEADGIGFATVINLDQYGEGKTYRLTFDVFEPPPTASATWTPIPSQTPTPSRTPTITPTPFPSSTWTPSPVPAASATPGPTQTPAELIAPGNLSCHPTSPTSITVGWADYTVGETGFRIEQSPDGQTWNEVATTGADETNTTVTGLTPGTKYWFRVRAHRESDNVFSGYSNVANCTTPSQ